MASMSRRVFLKCAGAAALAVTASGIFAGCSEEGGGSGGTVYGANETVQINGVNVKLLGYQQGFASEIAGNYADETLIAICFGLDNQSENSIQMGNTAQNKLDDVWEAIKNNDFGALGKSDFVVVAKDKKLGHAAIGYKMTSAGISDILGGRNPWQTGAPEIWLHQGLYPRSERLGADRHPVYPLLCPERDPQLCAEPRQST